ncbi:MAG: 30S ribosomal protein S9 [Kiritimatiellaeota bacterium]|nr:30S ribosomal protein S9 [Kiritimatiellota bacterium]
MAHTAVEFAATGRRKTATAHVRLAAGAGQVLVNHRPYAQYFPVETLRMYIEQPLKATNTVGKFDIIASITGGGPNGQAGAMRHGIARALLIADAALREALKKGGFLTRDSRMKERKKYGQPGARKRFQFSKR